MIYHTPCQIKLHAVIKAWSMAVLCLMVISCNDDFVTETLPLAAGDTASDMFWHTRTRSSAEQQAMLRNHGVGFSYNAINGEKCDAGSVRCQIVNLDALKAAGVYDIYREGRSEMKTTCSHSFAEYCHNTNATANVSGGVIIYNGSYQKTASVFEHAMDTSVCFTTELNETVQEKFIDTNVLAELIHGDTPEQYLSDNFLYAISKLKAAGTDNVAVVDSFIEIFGTHVITDATVGGRLKLDVVTNSKTVTTFAQEQTIKEESLDLFFYRKSSTMTEDELKAATALLQNAELHLNVVGGDISPLNALIANPMLGAAAATSETLLQWQLSLNLDESSPWSSRCELIDMEVTPIWELIPDTEVSQRVQSRIIATAPTMQELYGNRNFINAAIPVNPVTVTTTLGGTPRTFSDPWVVDVVAANRHVATICKEWVPEIDPYNSVRVVYPIYENKLQMDAGLCLHNGKVYRVSWRYDRFQVDAETVQSVGDCVYLTFGYLEPAAVDGTDYQQCTLRIGYEWPGSININGSLTNTNGYCTTRKFLGNFFLDTDAQYTNLPNWSYITFTAVPGHYTDTYGDLLRTDQPYDLSGIKLNGRSGTANATRRMVRNADYTYYINTTEAPL